jgi:hypothetical protein
MQAFSNADFDRTRAHRTNRFDQRRTAGSPGSTVGRRDAHPRKGRFSDAN